MHSTRPLWQLEERVRNHLKPVPNTILAIMRPGSLILTATILRSSIKASREQNIVHQGGATSCRLNTFRSRPSFTPYTAAMIGGHVSIVAASHRESLSHLQTRDCYKPHIRLYNSAGRGGYRICSTSRRGGAPKRRLYSRLNCDRLA